MLQHATPEQLNILQRSMESGLTHTYWVRLMGIASPDVRLRGRIMSHVYSKLEGEQQ